MTYLYYVPKESVSKSGEDNNDVEGVGVVMDSTEDLSDVYIRFDDVSSRSDLTPTPVCGVTLTRS